MTDADARADPLARLRFLLEVTALEASHLAQTDTRLFAQPMTSERAAALTSDIAASEQVDAFVVRFGRLQDTVADKLLPVLLEQVAEPLGTAIDNLARAEKLGWLESVDDWLAARKLRNRMIHEYVRDADVLAAALSAGHAAVPLLLAATSAFAHLANVGKRLVKSPKVYLRDSGVLHALLGLATVQDLQGHPIAGASWEGFVVEQVAAALPPGAQLGFYRTAAGAEIDLVVEHGARKVAIEIKFSSAPKPTKGFWHALQDLKIDSAYVIAPVARSYPLSDQVKVIPVAELEMALA